MSDPQIRRANVLGVGVHAVNLSRALSLIESALSSGRKNYICVTGVHGVVEAQKDSSLRAILNSSFLTVPDGRPTVWVGWIQHFAEMDQVGGPELMLELCRRSPQKGYSHFLFGGQPGVVEELSASLREKFPGIRIVGTYTPPFRPLDAREEGHLIRMVAESAPDIFWVGISTPKQERFMFQYLPKLETKLMVGVGAAFDFHTGRAKLAPPWMQKAGLAWFHRLCQDPRRLWKRYALNIPWFLWAITLQLLGWRTCSIEDRAAVRT
jgi:N-acetylglucosaminyldiphosphoundecaprenol N-acetyl-beta-D-mannosaminyltransferase